MSVGDRYERVGTVSAHRLAQDHKWTTGLGEPMEGKAGAWLVSDDSGGERVVEDSAFRRTHEHLSGHTWRRISRVRARRVEAAETVRTTEGDATACAGDWVVTDEDGNSWPVRESHFRSAYVRVDSE